MDILLSISSTTDGTSREVKCALVDSLVVGRGAEDGVLLEGPDLSREHLVLTSDGVDVFVSDLSVNGTWLNGTRLRKSVKTRVHPDDAVEVPGYVLKCRLADEVESTSEIPASEEPTPIPEQSAPAHVPPPRSGPLAMLDPVVRFIGSFSFMEKFLVIVALSGLFLLYTYLGS